MQTLINLLLSLDNFKTLPKELIEEISELVLNKSLIRTVLRKDIDTLKSIAYFQPDKFKRHEIEIMFIALKNPQENKKILDFLET